MAPNKRILNKLIAIFITFIVTFLFIFPDLTLGRDNKTRLNDSQSLFYQANAFYEKNDFEQAIALYQQILANGHESGNLYYNLGNSYFKLGKRGMAILYYEKAKRLIPGDADLKANLTYALHAAEETNQNWKYDLWNTVTGFIPLKNLFLICSFFLFGLAFILIPAILFPAKIRDIKNNRFNPLWFWSLIICGCCLVFFAAITTVTFIDQTSSQAIVVKSGGSVHFEPKPEATVYYSLNEGTKVQILDEKDHWRLIKRQDGKRGWIEKSFIEKI